MTLVQSSLDHYLKQQYSHIFSHEKNIFFLGVEKDQNEGLTPQEKDQLSQLNPFSYKRLDSNTFQNIDYTDFSKSNNLFYPREFSYSENNSKNKIYKPKIIYNKSFEEIISSLFFNSVNNLLYIGFVNGDLISYNLDAKDDINHHKNRHLKSINRIILSHNGSHIITGGDDGKIIISPINKINHIECELKHSSGIQDIKLLVPDGKFICSSSCYLYIWNWKNIIEDPKSPPIPEKKLVHPLLNQVVINSFDIHPFNSSLIICGCNNGTFSIWDLSNAYPIKSYQFTSCPIWKVRFLEEKNEETQYCYTCDDDGNVLKWEINQNNALLLQNHYSPLQLVYKHPVSSIIDFDFWGYSNDSQNGINENLDSIIMLTEFGQPLIKAFR